MAQQDYSVPTSEMHKEELPQFTKKEDRALPRFAKEVPLRSIVKKHGGTVMIEYEWSMFGGEEIKISLAEFKDDPNLFYVHKIKVKDGEDVASFTIASTTYIIRKTSQKMAKELMKTGGALKASVLEAVGYFRTVKGNFYTITKVEGDAWALDGRLGLKTFSLQSMDGKEKRRLSDLITEELLKLYRQGYALTDFSLKDVIVTKKKVILSNITAIAKVSPSASVDNFISNLRAMVKGGIARKEDVVYGLALSFGAMRRGYSSWSRENGAESLSEVEMLNKLEDEVLAS